MLLSFCKHQTLFPSLSALQNSLLFRNHRDQQINSLNFHNSTAISSQRQEHTFSVTFPWKHEERLIKDRDVRTPVCPHKEQSVWIIWYSCCLSLTLQNEVRTRRNCVIWATRPDVCHLLHKTYHLNSEVWGELLTLNRQCQSNVCGWKMTCRNAMQRSCWRITSQ